MNTQGGSHAHISHPKKTACTSSLKFGTWKTTLKYLSLILTRIVPALYTFQIEIYTVKPVYNGTSTD